MNELHELFHEQLHEVLQWIFLLVLHVQYQFNMGVAGVVQAQRC